MPADLSAGYQQMRRAALDPDPRAAVVAAGNARDADDLALLLDVLGLSREVAAEALLLKLDLLSPTPVKIGDARVPR